MLSALERFKRLMGMGDEPDTDDSIKENNEEYLKKVNRYNDSVNSLREACSLYNTMDENLTDAEKVMNILRKYGIDRVALKILCSSKLYKDVWKIVMPSVEGLGTNTESANELADILESKIPDARANLKEDVIRKVKDTWDSFNDVFCANNERIENINKKISRMTIDEKKSKNKEVIALSYISMERLLDVVRINVDAMDSFCNALVIDYEKPIYREVSNIVDDIVSERYKYYALMQKLNEYKASAESIMSSVGNSKMDKSMFSCVLVATQLINRIQQNYIKLGYAVLDCEKR